jgi:hypothetical protein
LPLLFGSPAFLLKAASFLLLLGFDARAFSCPRVALRLVLAGIFDVPVNAFGLGKGSWQGIFDVPVNAFPCKTDFF